MSPTTITRTHKVVAQNITPGMVIAANLIGTDPYSATLYTVEEVYPILSGDETVTVKLRYNYDGAAYPLNARVVDISLMNCVTVVR